MHIYKFNGSLASFFTYHSCFSVEGSEHFQEVGLYQPVSDSSLISEFYEELGELIYPSL